jgi:RNase adaptor protein for sRNA GlmZ degradation
MGKKGSIALEMDPPQMDLLGLRFQKECLRQTCMWQKSSEIEIIEMRFNRKGNQRFNIRFNSFGFKSGE